MMRERIRQCSAVAMLAVVVGLNASSRGCDGAEPTQPLSAERVPTLPTELTTSRGDSFRLTPEATKAWTVVCFLGTECPLARLYAGRLQTLADEFEAQSVQFLGVFSNRQDSPAEIAAYVREHTVRFATYRDDFNRLADLFLAERTPEVFVINHAQEIVYRGRIDNQYTPGVARASADRHELRETLSQLVAGEPVAVSKTDAEGCLIGRVRAINEDSDVTFCDQIVRILNRHCVECHRPGEIGPFELVDYDEIVGWAEMIQEVVDEERMPPWHASAKSVGLRNERRLSGNEKQSIRDWVAAGAPYGDENRLPDSPNFVSGWQTSREPDLVLAMRDRAFEVPADGTVEYQYFVVDPGFEEDRWVSEAQAVPGNPSVVHHIIVFVRPPDGARFRGVGWVTAYVPGQRAPKVPPAHARRIPAGSKLVFQMHYTPNGERQSDLSKVGLLFAEEPEVEHELYTVVGIDQDFEIPPQASNHRVDGRVAYYPANGKTDGDCFPHMQRKG